MNKFILLKAATPALYEHALERLRERALAQLPYRPSGIRVRQFRDSLVLFANFEISDSAGFEKHYVHTAPERTFAFDGLPYGDAIRIDRHWAEQFAEAWTRDETLIESTHGTWACASFGPEGGRCLSDFTGMTPLFYWSDADYLAVSPRQMLLSAVCGGDLEADLDGLAWLSGQSNLIGAATPWKGVQHLPPQWTLTFSPVAGDLTPGFLQREIFSHNRAEADRFAEPFDEAAMDAAVHDLLGQTNALARLPLGEITLDITGGLDSRLVAALAMASDLKQRVRAARTFGPEDGHDRQVGAMVAQLVGLPHEGLLRGQAAVPDPAKVLNTCRYSTFHYEAGIVPTDGSIGAGSKSRLVLTGSAGEIYRRHCKPHMQVHLADEPALVKLFADYHQKTDPLGVQHPALTARQSQTMQWLAQSFHRAGAGLNDVSDVFFMRYRLPLWNGVIMNNLYSGARVYPLVNYRLAKLAFSWDYRHRLQDRLHFEVMLRLNPAAAAAPFLNFRWPDTYAERARQRGVEVAREPFKLLPMKAGGPAQISAGAAMTTGAGLELARSYLLDIPHSRLFDLINPDRLAAVLSDGALPPGIVPIKQVFALIAMQALLNGDMDVHYEGPVREPVLDGVDAKQLFGVAQAAVVV